MPAAMRSVMRSRRWFQSAPAAEASSLATSGGSAAGAWTLRWAGGRTDVAPRASPPRRPSVRTHCSGTNSSDRVRERRIPSGVSTSGPWPRSPPRTVLAPRRATLPHPLRTTGGREDRPSSSDPEERVPPRPPPGGLPWPPAAGPDRRLRSRSSPGRPGRWAPSRFDCPRPDPPPGDGRSPAPVRSDLGGRAPPASEPGAPRPAPRWAGRPLRPVDRSPGRPSEPPAWRGRRSGPPGCWGRRSGPPGFRGRAEPEELFVAMAAIVSGCRSPTPHSARRTSGPGLSWEGRRAPTPWVEGPLPWGRPCHLPRPLRPGAPRPPLQPATAWRPRPWLR